MQLLNFFHFIVKSVFFSLLLPLGGSRSLPYGLSVNNLPPVPKPSQSPNGAGSPKGRA